MPYKDKAKQAAASRRHYERNKTTMVVRASRNNTKTKAKVSVFLETYLQSHPCVDCGEVDLVVLDFDHVRGEKTANVSDLKAQCYSLKAVQAEVAKCEVRCSNCHRRVTHQRRVTARAVGPIPTPATNGT